MPLRSIRRFFQCLAVTVLLGLAIGTRLDAGTPPARRAKEARRSPFTPSSPYQNRKNLRKNIGDWNLPRRRPPPPQRKDKCLVPRKAEKPRGSTTKNRGHLPGGRVRPVTEAVHGKVERNPPEYLQSGFPGEIP